MPAGCVCTAICDLVPCTATRVQQAGLLHSRLLFTSSDACRLVADRRILTAVTLPVYTSDTGGADLNDAQFYRSLVHVVVEPVLVDVEGAMPAAVVAL